MSCQNSTGPIDIIESKNILNCRGKCNLNYSYNSTSVLANNKEYYLQLVPNNRSSNVLEFSTNARSSKCSSMGGNYKLKDLRIYHPSIHTFNGRRSDAELIIYHENSGGGNDLIICIPISTTSGTQIEASNQLSQMIKYTLGVAQTPGSGGSISGFNLDLNNFIPNKGFYTYSASLPFLPCSRCVSYIVYSISEASINISEDLFSRFKKIIRQKKIPIQNLSRDLGLAYNSAGAGTIASNDDEIYIDCQPVGSSGQTLIKEKTENSIDFSNINILEEIKKFFNTRFGSIIIGIIIIVLIYNFFNTTKNFIFRQSGGSSLGNLKKKLKSS